MVYTICSCYFDLNVFNSQIAISAKISEDKKAAIHSQKPRRKSGNQGIHRNRHNSKLKLKKYRNLHVGNDITSGENFLNTVIR